MNQLFNKMTSPDLKNIIDKMQKYFIYAGIFSAGINILMLVPIIYMLQVYDRVISSGSYSTLAMLTLIMMVLLSASGGFEWVRNSILVSASNQIEKSLRARITSATFKRSLLTGGLISNTQPVNDLLALRQFLTGPGIFALLDAPWFPIYVGVMFMFHPWFGAAGIFAGIIMITLAYAAEKSTSNRLKEANSKATEANVVLSGTLKNSEVIAAMGMDANLESRQQIKFDDVVALQTAASEKSGLLTSLSKTFRMIMQSLLLGLGALLALRQEISPGMMIAGSLLLGRALAPIDMLVGSWKGFVAARGQFDRLNQLLLNVPEEKINMPLPAPTGNLTLNQVAIAPPASSNLVVRGVSLEVTPGETLAIIGPSASGKSSLARAILGIWPAHSGKIRLDGSDVSKWDRTELGPHIGYLPQDIELFTGTIAQNICRFSEENSEKIVEAAKSAGVHELILHLPDGYNTIISGIGGVLSGGQRQRIGLARALYGNPKLLLLDEPNSNLDDEGERQLLRAMENAKVLGSTTVVITHRTMILKTVDKLLVLSDGVPKAYGPRDEVLSQLQAGANA